MFGVKFAENINRIIKQKNSSYICDTFITQSRLHFVLRKKELKGDDPFLLMISKNYKTLSCLLDNLAKETLNNYIENSINFSFINNSIEGSLSLDDHISRDFMFIYDESLYIEG